MSFPLCSIGMGFFSPVKIIFLLATFLRMLDSLRAAPESSEEPMATTHLRRKKRTFFKDTFRGGRITLPIFPAQAQPFGQRNLRVLLSSGKILQRLLRQLLG